MTKEQVAAELVARIAKIGGEDIMSATVKVDIQQLPHGEGLALPAYQSAHAAGLDLLAAVPERRADDAAAGQTRDGPDGLDDRAAAGLSRRRSGRARALPPNTASPC